MRTLVLNNVEIVLFRNLRAEAERNGRSIEEEHYTILSEVLGKKRWRTLAEALYHMPKGEDNHGEFDRIQ